MWFRNVTCQTDMFPEHINFYGDGGKAGPVLVSLELPTKEQKDLYHDNDLQLRALVRTKYVRKFRIFVKS